MDFLSQDPDIAPELVILLTEKLKKAKSALDLMDQENKQLRMELESTQRGACNDMPSDDEFDVLGAVCRAEDCPSTKYAKDLKESVRLLKDELEVQSQKHRDDQAEISRLQKALVNAEANHIACKTKLEAYREALYKLNDVPIGSLGSEAAIEVDYAMASEGHDRASESAASTNEDPGKIPAPVQQQQETDGANKPASIEEQAGTACLPENVDNPHALPEVIQQLSQDGFLFIPGCTMAKPAGRFAWVYMPSQKCTLGDTLSWTDNQDFDEYRTKKDMFYNGRQGVCYTGTYEYDKAEEMPAACFRCLKQCVREALFVRAFTIDPKDVPDDKWEAVHKMFWEGTAKLKRFRFKRAGFNQPLYDALLAARGPTREPPPMPDQGKSKISEGQKKRKKNEHTGPPVPKKPKH